MPSFRITRRTPPAPIHRLRAMPRNHCAPSIGTTARHQSESLHVMRRSAHIAHSGDCDRLIRRIATGVVWGLNVPVGCFG